MASPITLLTKVRSGRLGEIVTFKCDNVFEAIYAVKNNTKMYKNPVLKKRSSSPSKDDDKKKGKEKKADDDKMDDSVINYYKVKMQCSNLPNPKALKSDKHERARSYLKRARVTIVDDDDVEAVAMDDPIPTGKGQKHVLYKDGHWYAVLKTDSDQDSPMTNKEMKQLEKDFAEHAALQEKRRSKRVPGDENDELLAFVSSFVGQSADNLSRVQRYEKAVIKRFEDDLRSLEEELKAEYKKHHHKDKRMTKDETIFNSDKFKEWYAEALKERMSERMSEQKGGVLGPMRRSTNGSTNRFGNTPYGAIIRPRPDVMTPQTTPEDDAPLEMKDLDTMNTELYSINVELQNIIDLGNEFLNQIEPHYMNTVNTDPLSIQQGLVYPNEGPDVFLMLASLNPDFSEITDLPMQGDDAQRSKTVSMQHGGGFPYENLRLAADLKHDFGYDYAKINPEANKHSKQYKSEDGFIKYVIHNTLVNNPDKINRFSVKTVTEWQKNTRGNLQESFQGDNMMVIDGSIPKNLVKDGGVQKVITVGHLIDPFLSSQPDLTPAFYINKPEQLSILKNIFEKFFKEAGFVRTFYLKANNTNIEIAVSYPGKKEAVIKVEAQLFSIANIKDIVVDLNKKKSSKNPLYKALEPVLPKTNNIEHKKLFFMMFKEIGDHIQLHELKRNKESFPPIFDKIQFATQDRILYADAIYQDQNVLFPIKSFHSKFNANHLKVIFDLNSIVDDLVDEKETGRSTSASPADEDDAKYIICYSKKFKPIDDASKIQTYWDQKIRAFAWRFNLIGGHNSHVLNDLFQSQYQTYFRLQINFDNVKKFVVTTILGDNADMVVQARPIVKSLDFSKTALLFDLLLDALHEMNSFYNDGVYIQTLVTYSTKLQTALQQLVKLNQQAVTQSQSKTGILERVTRSLRGKDPMQPMKEVFQDVLKTLKMNKEAYQRIITLQSSIKPMVTMLNQLLPNITSVQNVHTKLKGYVKQMDLRRQQNAERIKEQMELMTDRINQHFDNISNIIHKKK